MSTEIPPHKIHADLEFTGKHRFVVLCVYEIANTVEWLETAGREFTAGLETLVTVEGPGCFFCGLPLVADTMGTPCTRTLL